MSPPKLSDQTLVRPSCLDDDSQGTRVDVLWEKELDAQILEASTWKDLGKKGFDPPDQFSAYLHTLRWNLVTSTNPRLFQSPLRAGIQVQYYQLEPLRKALRLPRVNLFIADDVGLGKTIEAGLILRELIMRQKVRSVVVACPASVTLQWRDELENRFGLTFVIFDREYVMQRRRERGYGINPWNTHTRFIVSHSLLRDTDYSGPLQAWLGDFKPGSLLILDEAHNAAPASGARYAIDSHFTRAVRDVSHRFEHRLFLSATPHNGHSNSFSALLEILDPQRFCRGVTIQGPKLLEEVMVRRLKDDLRQLSGGFPERDVVQLDIDGLPEEAPELSLAKLLAEYRAIKEARLKSAAKSVQTASGLVTISLQKRLLSYVEAFSLTLGVHRRSFEKRTSQAHTKPTVQKRDFSLLRQQPGADEDRAELSESEIQAEELEQVAAATEASAADAASAEQSKLLEKERSLLDRMEEIARGHRGKPDGRIRKLVAWMQKNMCPAVGSTRPDDPAKQWNNRRIVIFTEFSDTKRYLEQQLRSAVAGTDRADHRIATFHGGMNEQSREDIKRAFNADPSKHPLRILIATDAAREGVNLQNHCSDLFHFDIPWNPSRMEQRNGRIDRKLQRAPKVYCYYFYYKQRPEDRVLQVLVRKTKTIQKELGSLSQVIEEKLLDRGIKRDEIDTVAKDIEKTDLPADLKSAINQELEIARQRMEDLASQQVELQDILSRSQATLNFTEAHFRQSLSCALGILGAEGLTPLNGSAVSKPRWKFPDLDKRHGADSTWAETLDSLRPPRRRDQKPWEWRKDSPIRPIVFEDPGEINEDVVHLHLEHRVVRRLLNRFLAQGFVHDDLSRACVSQTRDAVPRVIVLGRLSLYGPNAARLHDEIVTVAARWVDPNIRKETLKPYAEEAEGKTLELLETSLEKKELHSVAEAIRSKLAQTAPRDVEDLLPHLRQRAEALAKQAEEKLAARGEKEAKDMHDIIQGQRKRIETTIKEFESSTQLQLGFPDMSEIEVNQRKSEHRHWQMRLGAIDKELKEEPARIREGYSVKARRIEPVGLVYLWPVSG